MTAEPETGPNAKRQRTSENEPEQDSSVVNDARIETEHNRDKVVDQQDTAEATSTADSVLPSFSDPFKDSGISYPIDAANVPSKGMLKKLYEIALENGLTKKNADRVDEFNDQVKLVDAGLLSLEQVILLAVAYEEEKVCKSIQAKLQRDSDSSNNVANVVKVRQNLYESVRAAVIAAQKSRIQREVVEAQRDAEWKRQEDDRLQRLTKEEQRMRELQDKAHLRERKKQWPRNQEMWREVAYLMTEGSKLQKEERMWAQTCSDIEHKEKEWEKEMKKKQNQSNNSEKASVNGDSKTDNSDTHTLDSVEQAIEEIILSSSRMIASLESVQTLVEESESARKALYTSYKKDHQFKGYQGIKDAKGLVKALSQSQDIDL